MTAKPSNSALVRAIRAAVRVSGKAESPEFVKLAAMADALNEVEKRKTDYAARGQLAWATRQKNERAAARH